MEGLHNQFTLMGMWEAMNWLARGVVIILALMSVWSLTIGIERQWRFHKAKTQSAAFAREVTPLLQRHDFSEAIARTRDPRFKSSHLARVLGAGLGEFQEAGPGLTNEFDLVDAGRRAVDREAMVATAEMKRGLGNLATISTSAPFIGLFGTVVGIIHAFQGMAVSGSGGLGAVSAGISEALFTTAFGLFVAIPAVWLYNYFIGRVESFQVEMANSSAQLVDFLMKSRARMAAARGV